MTKLYQIELDRNERDFTTFLKSRNVSLSRKAFKILVAAEGLTHGISLFDTDRFQSSLRNNKPGRSKTRQTTEHSRVTHK